MMRVKCEALCIVAFTHIKFIVSGCDLYLSALMDACNMHLHVTSHTLLLCVSPPGEGAGCLSEERTGEK